MKYFVSYVYKKMGRKAIQVEEEVFNAVKAQYPGMSWSAILRLLLEPRGSLKRSKEKPYTISDGPMVGTVKPIDSLEAPKDYSIYATKEDVKELKDKFSKVLSDLINKNKLQR